MKRIGVLVNTTRLRERPETVAPVKRAVDAIADGATLLVAGEAAALLGRPQDAADENELSDAELLIVFGGDGTILRGARLAAPRGLPVLGVNMGGFGFLAEVGASELATALPDVLDGRYELDERMMLQARVEPPASAPLLALNDMVVTRTEPARVMRVRVAVNGEHLATYAADGVIVATPTGSTAYSLSAGGPIVHPGVEALLITPICPHTFNARSVIINPSDDVTVEVAERTGDVVLTVDGRIGTTFAHPSYVTIRKAAQTTVFIRLRRDSFYSMLRRKLSWGQR
ncbi:MAG TPA: NAD(+)/NADH kinase [bacterium]|nr:NAD(+)/NADH kinase [bacterium]